MVRVFLKMYDEQSLGMSRVLGRVGSIGDFMPICCTFLVICQGWTLVDALSYFVHHFCSLARK